MSGKIVSPYDCDARVTREIRNLYLCQSTGKRFRVTTGTIFARTKMPLLTWFKVIWQFAVEPEISTIKASRRIGINQKTVWNMKQKLDQIFDNKRQKEQN